MIISKLLKLILPKLIFDKLKLLYTNILTRIKFSKKDINTIFEIIYKENHWQSKETKSGIGSELKNTESLIKKFQNLLEKYHDFNGNYSDKSLCLWEIKKIKFSQK